VGPLLLLFIVVPAVELMLLIEIGKRIGGLETVLMIILTGTAGAALAKRAGLGVLARIQADLAQGRLPAESMVDGAIVLAAGALLVTPGILTDLLGLLCLIPAFRALLKTWAWRRIEAKIAAGQLHVHAAPPTGPIIDVEPPDRDQR